MNAQQFKNRHRGERIEDAAVKLLAAAVVVITVLFFSRIGGMFE